MKMVKVIQVIIAIVLIVLLALLSFLFYRQELAASILVRKIDTIDVDGLRPPIVATPEPTTIIIVVSIFDQMSILVKSDVPNVDIQHTGNSIHIGDRVIDITDYSLLTSQVSPYAEGIVVEIELVKEQSK